MRKEGNLHFYREESWRGLLTLTPHPWSLAYGDGAEGIAQNAPRIDLEGRRAMILIRPKVDAANVMNDPHGIVIAPAPSIIEGLPTVLSAYCRSYTAVTFSFVPSGLNVAVRVLPSSESVYVPRYTTLPAIF